MTTELDRYALRQLSELEAAQRLTGMSTAELRYIVAQCGLKAPKTAEKADLVVTILRHTHPARPTAPAATTYQQEMF